MDDRGDSGDGSPGYPIAPPTWRKVALKNRSRDEQSIETKDVEDLLEDSGSGDGSKYGLTEMMVPTNKVRMTENRMTPNGLTVKWQGS